MWWLLQPHGAGGGHSLGTRASVETGWSGGPRARVHVLLCKEQSDPWAGGANRGAEEEGASCQPHVPRCWKKARLLTVRAQDTLWPVSVGVVGFCFQNCLPRALTGARYAGPADCFRNQVPLLA